MPANPNTTLANWSASGTTLTAPSGGTFSFGATYASTLTAGDVLELANLLNVLEVERYRTRG